jgi:hypothetical protein
MDVSPDDRAKPRKTLSFGIGQLQGYGVERPSNKSARQVRVAFTDALSVVVVVVNNGSWVVDSAWCGVAQGELGTATTRGQVTSTIVEPKS